MVKPRRVARRGFFVLLQVERAVTNGDVNLGTRSRRAWEARRFWKISRTRVYLEFIDFLGKLGYIVTCPATLHWQGFFVVAFLCLFLQSNSLFFNRRSQSKIVSI